MRGSIQIVRSNVDPLGSKLFKGLGFSVIMRRVYMYI